MANRHTLHISRLDSFKEWLVKDGWEIEEQKGAWEVLRARKSGRQNPLIVYKKADAKEHLSLMDRDSGVIGAFLRDCKKPQTQSDRIRSMRDEELAEFLSENTNCDCCNIQCQDKLNCPSMSSCYCRHLEWLQSEVEVGEWKKKR